MFDSMKKNEEVESNNETGCLILFFDNFFSKKSFPLI